MSRVVVALLLFAVLIPQTNADVTIENEATGVRRTTTSTGAGVYIVRDMSPGSYTVTVQAAGDVYRSTPCATGLRKFARTIGSQNRNNKINR